MKWKYFFLFSFLIFISNCSEKHPTYRAAENEFQELQKEILSTKLGLDSTVAANLTLDEINNRIDKGDFRFRTLNVKDIRYIHRLIAFAKLVPVTTSEVAVIETEFGSIVFRFYSSLAPGHCANFKLLANSGYFDGIFIHKIIPGKVVYIGSITTIDFFAGNDEDGTPGYNQKLELNNVPFKRGVVGMVRSKRQSLSSHGSQFFIVLKLSLIHI